MKVLGTHHVAIITPDVQRLARFYTETVGLEITKEWKDAGIVFVDAGSTLIELLPEDDHEPGEQPPELGRGMGLNHLALRVESVDDAYDELVGKGAGALVPPEDFKDVRIAFLADPDGNVIELFQTSDE